MQLSYNLIKEESALSSNKKKIETSYVRKIDEKEDEFSRTSIENEIRKSYESLGENIIKRSKMEAEKIVMNSRRVAVDIEREAYEKGYNQGQENGYEDGFKDGYNKGLEQINLDTEIEVKAAIDKAENIFKLANSEYKSYIKEKEEEIIRLAFEMAKVIAEKELIKDDGILPVIESLLNDSKGEENIIIKCNSNHIEAIEEKIVYYKKAYAIKGEIFVLEDPLMESGNAIIEKNTGKAVIGLDIGFKRLEEALFD
ncbi:FliH/SctL family protein [Clostridium sp.]|uniref:FliH/SctL family protein n=1 Tax=Clostridium sp. TaxID=1506 RepID=UPI00261EF31E|nr:FliH/SctL family protein [Clostridium sp.]